MKLRLTPALVGVIVLVISAGFVHASDPVLDGDCAAVEREVLECGIEIVVVPRAGTGDDEVQVWTMLHRGPMAERSGGMDEDGGRAWTERGASVIAARAVLTGAGLGAGFTREDMLGVFGNDLDQALGGRGVMAMTDHLSFMLGVDSGAMVDGLRLARGVVEGFALRSEDFKLIQESLMKELVEIEEDAERASYRRWLPDLVDGSGYSQTPLPTIGECGLISVADVNRFVEREWRADQANVLVVGDVDASAVFALAREVFDGVERPEGVKTASSSVEFIKDGLSGRVVTANDGRLPGTRLGMVWFGDDRTHIWDEAGYRKSLVRSVAGEAMRYRINRLLRREFGVVTAAKVDMGLLMGRVPFGQIVVELEDAERGSGSGVEFNEWGEVLSSMEAERRRVVRDGVGEQEIERARDWLMQQWGYQIDQWDGMTNAERARLLSWMLATGQPLMELDQWLDRAQVWVADVDLDQVNSEIRGLFGKSDPAVIVVRGVDDELGVDRVQGVLEVAARMDIEELQADWFADLSGPILDRSGAGGEVEGFSVHPQAGVMSVTLSNGLVVHHRQMDDEPDRVRIHVRVGFDELESAAMHGAGDVFTQAIENGQIRSRTEREVRGILIENEIEYETVRGSWGLEIAISAPAESFERSIEFVYALLTDLRIEQSLIDSMRREASDGARMIGVPIGAMEAGIGRGIGGEMGGAGYELRPSDSFGDDIDARSVREWIGMQVWGGGIEIGIAGDIDSERAILACAQELGGIAELRGDQQSPSLSSLDASLQVEGFGAEDVCRLSDPSGREGVVIGFSACTVQDLGDLRALTVAGMILDHRIDDAISKMNHESEGVSEVKSTSGVLVLDVIRGQVVVFARIDCEPGMIDSYSSFIDRELEILAVDGIQKEELAGPMSMIDRVLGGGVERAEFWAQRLAEIGYRGGDVDSIWTIQRSYAGIDVQEVNEAFGRWYNAGVHFRVELVNE
ncbi:MAG: insulinase family protein [Phycisphaerales bacterium]